jgi:hypothetical protein
MIELLQNLLIAFLAFVAGYAVRRSELTRLKKKLVRLRPRQSGAVFVPETEKPKKPDFDEDE